MRGGAPYVRVVTLAGVAIVLSTVLASTAFEAQSISISEAGFGVPIEALAPAAAGTITVNGLVGTQASTFWAVSMDGTANPANHTLASMLNATPIRALRYGAAWADETNWSKGCFYNGDSTCSSITNSVTSFATLCQWLPNYQCILGVPAEINSVSTLAYEVQWLKSTTAWQPSCFAIGDEPGAWNNWNLPWTSWSSSNSRAPTAQEYATMVKNYTATLRSIDGPNTCIVGIEAQSNQDQSAQPTFIKDTTATAPNVTSVSFHYYPNEHCNGQTPSTLLNFINQTRIAVDFNRYVKPNAGGLPVSIHEYNLGLTTKAPYACAPFVADYTGAVFTSSQIAQSLALGISQFGYFRFAADSCYDCMINPSSNPANISWVYYLYSDLLDRMFVSNIYNVTFTGGNPETFMVMGTNGASNETLLISNANATVSDTFDLAGVVPANWSEQITTQNTTSVRPVTGPVVDPTATVTLPPQSTMLIQTFPAAAASSPGGIPAGGAGGGVTSTTGVGGLTLSSSSMGNLVLLGSAGGLIAVAGIIAFLPGGRHRKSHGRHRGHAARRGGRRAGGGRRGGGRR